MKDLRYRFALLQSLLIGLLIAQPILAERPPSGYGRPPIHMKPFAMSSPTGLTPNQVQHAYGFDQLASQIGGQGAGQTIGIVDAYDDPNIANDLAVFSSTFGLPQCNTSNPCFQKIYASGFRPAASSGWSLEIALDVEWAHAIAPQARILLV